MDKSTYLRVGQVDLSIGRHTSGATDGCWDAIIAKLKGVLRKCYSKWACDFTMEQIGNGIEPSNIKIPSDVPTCRRNLFEWLSKSVDHLNETEKAGMVHCWEKTNLLKAWEHKVQIEAMHKAHDIFPNAQWIQRRGLR